MEAYREVARYTSFLFLIMQIVLLIDFGYTINEWLVDLDERSESESMFTYKLALLGGSTSMYAGSITMWVLMSQWFGHDGCGAQQALISITIIFTLLLSLVSCTKFCPHGTIFTSAVVTAYATYQCYSALASHPNASCNGSGGACSASDMVVGALVFGVAMVSMVMSAYSATSSKDAIIGKSSTSNSDLTVTLDAGANSDEAAAEDEPINAESWWYYHLMMVVVSLYFAMLLSDWSIQPVQSLGHSVCSFSVSLESFWVKVAAQWVCLLVYGWTLLAPYLLRDVRDFGIEFDF